MSGFFNNGAGGGGSIPDPLTVQNLRHGTNDPGDEGTLGFYGTVPIPLQTGVTLSTGGIYNALLALGLIES